MLQGHLTLFFTQEARPTFHGPKAFKKLYYAVGPAEVVYLRTAIGQVAAQYGSRSVSLTPF